MTKWKIQQKKQKQVVYDLSTTDVNINGNEKDNHEAEEEKGMNKDGDTTCLEIDEFHYPAFAWQLEK